MLIIHITIIIFLKGFLEVVGISGVIWWDYFPLDCDFPKWFIFFLLYSINLALGMIFGKIVIDISVNFNWKKEVFGKLYL